MSIARFNHRDPKSSFIKIQRRSPKAYESVRSILVQCIGKIEAIHLVESCRYGCFEVCRSGFSRSYSIKKDWRLKLFLAL